MEKTWSPSSGWVCTASTTPDPSVVKAFKVYNFIVGKGGEIELFDLVKHPSPLTNLTEAQALEWLTDFQDQKESDQLEKPCFVVRVNSQGRNIVRVWVRVKLCFNYEKNGSCVHGVDCIQWHVCKSFLEGNCTNAKLCTRSHDLVDEENIQKARKYKFEKLPSATIRKVLVKNLPLVCEAYMNKKCKDKMCHDLHLCPRYVRGSCESQENCSFGLSHDHTSRTNKEIFSRFSVPNKYLFVHVLLPKLKLESEKVTDKGTHPVKDGDKRRHKVDNLNNLNSVGDTKATQLVNQNVPLNIEESTTKNSKKANNKHKKPGLQAQKNDDIDELNKRAIEILRVQADIFKQRQESQRKPQPLMAKAVSPGVVAGMIPSGVGAGYPSLPPDPFTNRPDQQSGRKGKQKGKKSFENKPKTVQQHSKENVASGDDEDDKTGDGMNQPGWRKKQELRKRRQENWQSKKDGRKGSDEGTPSVPLTSAFPEEGLPMNITLSSDENKGRRRRCSHQRQTSQGSNDDGADMTKVNQENEEEDEVDLIAFGDEDLPVDESKLIDLDFDDSDQGLSQMSETQSQVMWDLFSQDQLYSPLDSLSQPEDSLLDSPPVEDTVSLGNSALPQTYQFKNAPEKAIFNCVVMKFGGTATFSEIANHPDLWDPQFTEQKQWFVKHQSSFLLIEDCTGDIEQVKAISFKAKICFRYSGKSAACTQENCPYFHVCKEYIAKGRCSNFGKSCKRNHGFRDSHNKDLANRLFSGINFTNKQLQQVIQSSTPQICLDYNDHRCQRKRRCTKVHICKNYGHKRCQCKLAHGEGLKTSITKALLARFRIHLPEKVNMYMVAQTQLLVCQVVNMPVSANKPNSDIMVKENQKSDMNVSKSACKYYINSNVNNHICLAFLIGKCTKGSKCSEHHCPLPHQWIYMSGNQWIMLDEKENMELEKLFCEDNINDEPVVISMKLDLSSSASAMSHLHNVPYIYNVNLKSMQIGLLDDESLLFSLRRLSTMSKVLIPGCHLATTWYWYYKNEDDIYVEYQPSHGFKDPTSSTIEKFYQEGNSRYDFRVGNHDYRLYFVDMYQKNKDPVYGTKRDVMRRPELLYPDRAKNLIRTCKLPTPDSGELPPFWKRMTECQPFLLKKLNAKTKEFKEIQLLFFNTMGERQVNINSIDRVQNSFMWDKYQRKKNQMAKLAVDVDERSLFHGTAFRNIRSICKDNFDWRLYGQVTGNIYGEGAYFARDASFSHCYCHDDEDGVRYVFVAKVLVGSFTKGEKNYRRPPPKHPSDPHSELFDSCVDDVDSPQVFVMFDVDQYYPGHVIEYTCQPTEYPSAPTINNAGSRLSTSSNFASYYPSQSMIRQSVAMPTPVVTASAQASNLSLQRMNEELDKFASSSKKSDDSKQNCVVM